MFFRSKVGALRMLNPMKQDIRTIKVDLVF